MVMSMNLRSAPWRVLDKCNETDSSCLYLVPVKTWTKENKERQKTRDEWVKERYEAAQLIAEKQICEAMTIKKNVFFC